MSPEAAHYEAQLAAWKQKHGLPTDPNLSADDIAEALDVAADKKRPGTDYCYGCGEEFPFLKLHWVTPRENPYVQIDEDDRDENRPWWVKEEDRVHLCEPCRKGENDDEDKVSTKIPEATTPGEQVA